MSLYQKYRPKIWGDVVGQSFVVMALQSALVHNRTVGAYLFCGMHGSGKTSIARIFARSLNCLDMQTDGSPCNTCAHCIASLQDSFLDIIEIDAASHTGVDDVRQLIDQSQFPPTYGRKKVYIIDEVHMLSSGASSALLKTLEEPPEHVVFILATTETHKLLDTILSRVQRYDFGRVAYADIVARLEDIAKAEQYTYDSKAIQLIATKANGGMRDAINLLEKCTINNTLEESVVRRALAIAGSDIAIQFASSLAQRNIESFGEVISALESGDVSIADIIAQAMTYAYEQMLADIQSTKKAESPIANRWREVFFGLDAILRGLKISAHPWHWLQVGCYAILAKKKINFTQEELKEAIQKLIK
jgi:DNA polymerase III subunit gamma/tau